MTDPTLSASQLELLRKIELHFRCTDSIYMEDLSEQETEDWETLWGKGLTWKGAFGGLRVGEVGDMALAAHAHLTIEQCASDSCHDTFTREPDEEMIYCTDTCEAEQSARDAGENLHDRMTEGE